MQEIPEDLMVVPGEGRVWGREGIQQEHDVLQLSLPPGKLISVVWETAVFPEELLATGVF